MAYFLAVRLNSRLWKIIRSSAVRKLTLQSWMLGGESLRIQSINCLDETFSAYLLNRPATQLAFARGCSSCRLPFTVQSSASIDHRLRSNPSPQQIQTTIHKQWSFSALDVCAYLIVHNMFKYQHPHNLFSYSVQLLIVYKKKIIK